MFLQSVEILQKKRGYDIFKNGLDLLLKYAKLEKNEQIRKITADNLRLLIEDAVKMDNLLKQKNIRLSYLASERPFRKQIKEVISCEKPKVSFDSIIGLENAKKTLSEAIIMPLKFPELFVGIRKPWTGILLYGPPGTGKTQLAKACARDSTFFSISASDILSKYSGDSEKLIKELFNMAREQKPSIIFIDEIDSIGGKRNEQESDASRRIKTEFLIQMEGIGNNNQGILIIAATNLPWELDSALRRRFEKRIYIPVPDLEGRKSLIKKLLEHTPHCLQNEEICAISRELEGYSGADIDILVREAAYEPLRIGIRATHFKKVNGKMIPCSPSDKEGIRINLADVTPDELELSSVEFEHFLLSMSICRPSIDNDEIKKYLIWTKEFGQDQ